MTHLVALDQLYHYVDPEMKLIEEQLNNKTPKKVELAPKCQLMSTASKYIRQSRRRQSNADVKQQHNISDDNRSVSSNNSKVRGKKKKRYMDMSEIASQDVNLADMGLYLLENYSEQPNVVLKYLMDKEPNLGYSSQYEKDILKGWIMCLNREDRMEIEKERTWFPNPRNIELRHIESGLNEIYGVGPNRRLRPGEQASLIESIEKYLGECTKNINMIALRESSILEAILSWVQLEELTKFPFCMKQLECHFKIMATRWRHSGRLNLNNKNIEKAIHTAHSRGHFLDLNKREHPLVKYLLKYSTDDKINDGLSEKKSRSNKKSSQTNLHNYTHHSEVVRPS